MTFNILFVENDITSQVPKAVAAKQWSGEELALTQVFSPDDLEAALGPDIDLVLADIGFPDDEGGDVNRIDDILGIVERVSSGWPGTGDGSGPTLPVIVYTSRTFELKVLLRDKRRRLYDIWDKSVATPEYVAWRLGTVARERERARPGRVLQKAVVALTAGPSWRSHVELMLQKYTSGWSELDQIQRCGKMISAICDELSLADGTKMWDAIEQWEMIDRAADRRVRGHARHALHVFWLGYIIINDDAMSSIWEAAWSRLLEKRANREVVKAVDWREAMNAMWFLASIFHDVGYVAQDGPAVVKALDSAARAFDVNWFKAIEKSKSVYFDRADSVFATIRADGGGYQKLADSMVAYWKSSRDAQTPDHGCSSAGRLLGATSDDKKTVWWVQEAARSAALHSAFPKVNVPQMIDFENDPIACLLLMLDQLQTWDRERPETLAERDWPERAELVELEIRTDLRPKVALTIRYIVRRHVERSAVLFERVEEQLADVLRRLPVAAMRLLVPKLPFDVTVKFLLGDEEVKGVTA